MGRRRRNNREDVEKSGERSERANGRNWIPLMGAGIGSLSSKAVESRNGNKLRRVEPNLPPIELPPLAGCSLILSGPLLRRSFDSFARRSPTALTAALFLVPSFCPAVSCLPFFRHRETSVPPTTRNEPSALENRPDVEPRATK